MRGEAIWQMVRVSFDWGIDEGLVLNWQIGRVLTLDRWISDGLEDWPWIGTTLGFW